MVPGPTRVICLTKVVGGLFILQVGQEGQTLHALFNSFTYNFDRLAYHFKILFDFHVIFEKTVRARTIIFIEQMEKFRFRWLN